MQASLAEAARARPASKGASPTQRPTPHEIPRKMRAHCGAASGSLQSQCLHSLQNAINHRGAEGTEKGKSGRRAWFFLLRLLFSVFSVPLWFKRIFAA